MKAPIPMTELAENKADISILEESKDELQKILFSILHDFKNPMISILGYLRLIERELDDNASEKIKTYINNLKQSAFHLEDLLSDTTEAVFGGTTISESLVLNVKKLIHEIIEELKLLPYGGNIEYIIDDNLPNVRCDRKQAYRIFSNIIGNAVKFTSTIEKPRIEIGFNYPEFYIKDNGPGIDPKYNDKLFDYFTRFNGDDYDGLGIGLATAKRNIERIGGSIRIKSTPNNGATFFIKFPFVIKGRRFHNYNEGKQTREGEIQENNRRKLIMKTNNPPSSITEPIKSSDS